MSGNELSHIYRYRPVDECLSISGQPTVKQLALIAGAGFTTLINLALHDDPRYSLPDEAGVARDLGLNYVHIPVYFGAPGERDLLSFCEAMDTHADERVWVHCAANLRVATFLGLYRVIRLAWDRSRAFELMESLWQPDDVWADFIDAMLAKHAGTAQ
jgi:uncharacterized protein (TIGR01244 family)